MYSAVLILHSWIRWIALILGVMTTFAAFTDRTAGQSTTDRWGLFFMMVLDIQMLLGLLLYLVLSPFTTAALHDFGAAMRNPALRFWAAAVAAYFGFDLTAQFAILVIVLIASLALLRSRLVGLFGRARGVPSRTATLVGRSGIVTHDIDPTVGTGRVNVGGEDWAARSADPIAAGTRVRVVGADGIVLEVTLA